MDENHCKKCGQQAREGCINAQVAGAFCGAYLAMLREVIAPVVRSQQQGAGGDER